MKRSILIIAAITMFVAVSAQNGKTINTEDPASGNRSNLKTENPLQLAVVLDCGMRDCQHGPVHCFHGASTVV